MSSPVRILSIAGSLRRGSFNHATLRAASELAPEGTSIETFELDGIPAFNQDDEQNPPGKVIELKQRVRQADAILFVTPEYNYSIPSVLKNAIDWASRPYGDSAWNGKPAVIMGASIGAIGTARAKLIRIASHSSFGNLQLLSVLSVPISSVSRGSVQNCACRSAARQAALGGDVYVI